MTPEQYGGGSADGSAAERLGRRQRDFLYEVARQGGTCGLASAAHALATRDGREPSPARTRQIYTGLYDQLGTLVEADLVDYCEEEGTVRLTARGRALVPDERSPGRD